MIHAFFVLPGLYLSAFLCLIRRLADAFTL